ncbi:hypothetical protein [Liquorilactobacillus mali]|uniref:Uncharacterized protein n=1 Tax=Liquorilactobacillus mali KCTC 3596 = DSM 20444 TaxID=1046596 RepID=A0A0R2EF63_9LACO|nr:hypothetical protein [Liquorilactobacillus mali]KRN10861.1 hypothetical protein FD00_GL002104 [Liquorilactobacillus mali KCTC 3596 = DSM 20444]
MEVKHSELKAVKKLAAKNNIKHIHDILPDGEDKEFTFMDSRDALYFADLNSKTIEPI